MEQMKDLFVNILKNPDSLIPLTERIKELFRLKGLTVASITIAITMFFFNNRLIYK
jgi:hypothetical protein